MYNVSEDTNNVRNDMKNLTKIWKIWLWYEKCDCGSKIWSICTLLTYDISMIVIYFVS